MAKSKTRGPSKSPPRPAKRPARKGNAELSRILKTALDDSAKEMRMEIEAERLPADLLTLHFRIA